MERKEKDTRLNRLLKILPIFSLAYRRDIKKWFLKLVLILNVFLFMFALLNNMPSMLLFLCNIYFLYKYLLGKYPEESLKKSDRYNVIE